MGSATIEYTGNVADIVRQLDKVIEKQVKVRTGAKGIATDGKKAGDETAAGAKKGTTELSSMDKMTNKVVGSLKTYLGAAVGIAGVAKAWSFVNAEIRKVAEAQSALAMTGKEYNQVSLQLANQMGQARTNVGQRLSADVLESIQKAGRFGVDWERGKAVGIAAHVAFGIPGQLLAGEELDIARMGAAFTGYKGIGAEETGGMFKILAQVGAKTKIQAARRMKQFSMAYEAALSVDPAANIGGIVRFIGEYVKQGGTVEMGLARYRQAITGTGSEQEAAQRSRQMVMIMRGEKMQKELAGRMGVTAEAFQRLPMDVRMGEFGRFAGKAGEAELIKAGVATRRLGWVINLYGEGGFAGIQRERERLTGATGQQLIEELADFGTTYQARELAGETKAALLKARITRWTTMGETQMEIYRAMHQRHIAGEEILPYFRRDFFAHPEDWIRGEERGQEIVGYRAMRQRMGRIRETAVEQEWTYQRGAEWRYALTRPGQLYREAAKFIQPLEPSPFDPLTPREVGRMEEYLILLEALVQEVKKNTEATEKNTGGKEEGMRMNVMDPDANVE
jgi:hypothetical protein